MRDFVFPPTNRLVKTLIDLVDYFSVRDGRMTQSDDPWTGSDGCEHHNCKKKKIQKKYPVRKHLKVVLNFPTAFYTSSDCCKRVNLLISDVIFGWKYTLRLPGV